MSISKFKKIIVGNIRRIILLTVLISSLCAPLVISGTAYALFGTNSADEACKGLDVDNGTNGCDPNNNNDDGINNLIHTAINILSVVGGIICVIIILVAGIRLIVSQGDANAISTARNAIVYAIIGLVIIAMSQFLVRFVLGKVTNPVAKPVQTQPVTCNQTSCPK